MISNQGILVETKIASELNGRKISELNTNFKQMMIYLYGVVRNSEEVICDKVIGKLKPDIYVEYMGERKYISIKTGNATVIHTENIKTFCIFLRELGISNRTLQTILLHHYGDGTLDGSGEFRYSSMEIKGKLSQRIKEANEELNQSKEFVLKVLERCLISGVCEGATRIDGLYFGDEKNGQIVTRNMLIHYIEKSDWSWTENLHIGPMHIRPNARYAHEEIKSELKRSRTYIYWPNLSADIAYVARKFNP